MIIGFPMLNNALPVLSILKTFRSLSAFSRLISFFSIAGSDEVLRKE
jgi:hypothetical protein